MSNKNALIADLQSNRPYIPFQGRIKTDDAYSGKRGMFRAM